MDKEYYELMLKLTDEKHMAEAIYSVNSDTVIPGFRKGKAPRQKIISESYSKINLQKRLIAAIAASYFPDEKPSDDPPKSLSVSDETLAGNMAAYAFRQKENDFPLSIKEIRDAYERLIEDKRTLSGNEMSGSEEHSDDVSISNENSMDESQENDKPHKAPLKASVPVEKNEDRKEMRMKFFGYIQVVPSAYNTFYNFYPVAEIASDGVLTEIDQYERNERFPTKGNINIYAPRRNDERLEQLFHNGAPYVIELNEAWLEDNIRADGELNITNKKVSLNVLEEQKALHKPGECNLFVVIDYQEISNALEKGDIIRLPQYYAGDHNGEGVVLRDGNELIGPFQAMRDQTDGSWYVNPQLKKNHYILTTFSDLATQHISLAIPDSGYSAYSGNRVYVSLSNIQGARKDFISNDELIEELNRVLGAMNETEKNGMVVVNSAYTNLDLPLEILKKRRERLEAIFSQYNDLQSSIGVIQESVNALLVNASRSEKDCFDHTFAELAKDSDFMLSIQRYHIISDAIDEKNKELKEKETALDALQKKADETRKNQEIEKAALLTDEIKAKKIELDKVKTELAKKLESLGLADEIDNLKIQRGVTLELLEQAKREKKQVQDQTEELLDSFRTQVKQPLSAITQYVLQDEVATIISSALENADDQNGKKRVKARVDQYRDISGDDTVSVNNLVDVLCDRVRKYRNYSINEIVNILICVSQGFLTVFSGDPGTGKTSICDIIAHAMGVDQNDCDDEKALGSRYAIIPVERGWSSKRDFIGYYNPLTKSFDKNNSSIFEALETTSAELSEPNVKNVPPYLVLLDEANLSPMEYYWADFMRACDMPSKPAEIQLSEHTRFAVSNSLRFFATINNDHTTESLSPRLIDRAWVISLPQPTAPKEVEFEENYAPISLGMIEEAFGVFDPSAPLLQIAEDILKKVFEVCKEKLGVTVSPRSQLAIRKYCHAGSQLFEDNNGIDKAVIAVDYAVAQKVLPKLQGSGSYKQSLEELHKILLTNNLLVSASILKEMLQNGERNMQYYQYFA